MHLYIIRHAQSANNELYATTGGSKGRQADPPLTELGHRQAQVLARALAARPDGTALNRYALRHDRGGYELTHLYSSLMVRAIVTGGYIAAATGLPLQAWPEIHERGGLYDEAPETGEANLVAGAGRSFFAAEYPQLILPDTLGEEGWWNRPRELPEQWLPRAEAVWQELLARHGGTDDRVGIVTHGGFFQSLMSALVGRDAPTVRPHLSAWWFSISNASITHLVIEERVSVRYVNKVDHLPDELLTG